MGAAPSLDAWAAWEPEELARRLAGADSRWAVAGGWAVELHAGRSLRVHDDLEIAVDAPTFPAIADALGTLEWFAAGDGVVTRLGVRSTPASDTFQTWGWDPAAERCRVDVMRESWTGGRWTYRRDTRISLPIRDAIRRTPAGIPYLVPQIVLLFKAKHARGKDDADLTAALPTLSAAERAWLAGTIRTERPDHRWLAQIDRDPDRR